MSEPQKSEDFLANTGCPRIGVPNLSAHKMVFFWDLWPEILNLEISHIYILLTMSSFSNISIKIWFLDTCFLNWDLANLGHLRPTLSIWLKKMPTIGLFDVKGTHSRYQLSYLIMKVIIWASWRGTLNEKLVILPKILSLKQFWTSISIFSTKFTL